MKRRREWELLITRIIIGLALISSAVAAWLGHYGRATWYLGLAIFLEVNER